MRNFGGAIDSLRQWLEGNPALARIIYNWSNRREFSSLLEHERMLSDEIRVGSYAEAIGRNVEAHHSVIDLGTGTGILAMLAARQGATVYAIDHSDFIGVARRIALHNGLDDIRFIRVNSRRFTPPEKVDIIIHEQMGDYLFNESMLTNLLDLKRRVLKPGGRILPGRFQIFLEPVALNPRRRTPFIEEIETQGVRFDCLREAAKDLEPYLPHDYISQFTGAASIAHPLCAESPIMTVDLNEIDDVAALQKDFELRRPVVRAGTLGGLYFYFRATFDEHTQFDTGYGKTHWGNPFYRLRLRQYAEGDDVTYRMHCGNLQRPRTWSVVLL